MPNNLTRCPVGCFDLSAHAVNVAHACPDEGRVFGGEAFAFRSARPVSSPSPCCHPERGRFPADEGPAVRLTCPFRLFLFFSFSFLRCHPERGRCLSFLFFFSSFLLFFFSSFLSYVVIPSEALFADEGPAVRFASFVAVSRPPASSVLTTSLEMEKFAPPSPPT